MSTTDLVPNADVTITNWSSTDTTHYTEIDEDVDTPSTADKIYHTVDAETEVVGLTNAPGDYGTCNTVTLRVNGKASADMGFKAELCKADDTVLATVNFVAAVDTSQATKTSGAQAATLSSADVDGLKIVFTTVAV